MAKYELEVTASALHIRTGPSTSYQSVGLMPRGTVITSSESSNGWYKHDRGWSSGDYLKVLRTIDDTPPPQPAPPAPAIPDSTNSSTGSSLGIDAKVLDMLFKQSTRAENKIDGSTRLFGSPYQFTKQTDFRVNTKVDLGRKYLENIVAESPIVYFVPGRPNYLPDLSESERKGLTAFFGQKEVEGDNKSAIEDIIAPDRDIRYFDFVTDFVDYMKYVNLLCRMSAIYIGLGDEYVPGTTTQFKYYDWTDYKYKNDYISKSDKKKSVFDMGNVMDGFEDAMFGKYKYVQFYVEPNASFSESASNNTTTSKLEGAFDAAEGIVKELSFLTNTAAVKNLDSAKQSFANGMDDIAQKMLKNGNENFFTRLLGMSSTVLNGANIIFPELWGDSAYNKSYSITVNLVSPYGDKKSIFMNVIVPMMHLLALSCPRQATANSYASPFLVKVFAKGWFSCELGIVDSISIEKGGGGDSWTVDGLPSEVKVSLSVKDLYSNLMVTRANMPNLFFQNQGLIDFLAVTCGIDITKPNFLVKWETMFAVFYGKLIDLPQDIFKDLVQDLRNQVEKLYRL